MKQLLVLIATITLLLPACQEVEEFNNTPMGNFEYLWKTMDERYCFFEYKDSIVDWDEVYYTYRDSVTDDMTQIELFNLLGDMLAELQDGHVNLASSFNTSRYWKWFEDYPQNFDSRLVDEYYLNFQYYTAGGIKYIVFALSDGTYVGYMYYESFSTTMSETNLDYILYFMSNCDALIIDVRDNGGGSLSNVERIAGRFVDEEILSGYIQHKTGTGHNDFSELYPTYLSPSSSVIKFLDKPVLLLTNRSCYSATNNFVSVMRSLPNVRQVGDQTGGGSGLPFSGEIPNGWSIRFSASPIYDSNKQHTEFGIAPNYKIDSKASDYYPNLLDTEDGIIERAFEIAQYYKKTGTFPEENN